jgi:hypothetical protein
MNGMELLDGAASFIVRNQMAKLPENVPADFDHVFVADRHSQVGVDRLCCVRL